MITSFPKLILVQEENSKIKSLKPRGKEKGGRYYQGYCNRSKLKKYVGNDVCIYRSSLEYKFIQWCEKNNNIAIWSSECGYVPYMFENQVHRYYVDFVYMNNDGIVFYVEVKPYKEVLEAKYTQNNKNAEKWKATIKLCEQYGSKHNFKIITEKFFIN